MTIAELLNILAQTPNQNFVNNARCAFNKASKVSGTDYLMMPVAELPRQLPEIEHALMSLDNPEKSRSAWRSSIRKVYQLGIIQNLIPLQKGALVLKGCPVPRRKQCNSRCSKVKKVLEDFLKTVLPYRSHFDQLTAKDITAFVSEYAFKENQRESWAAFVKWWNAQCSLCNRAELRIRYKSPQPAAYKIAVSALPPHLRNDLATAQRNLAQPRKKGRHKGEPLALKTRQLMINDMLRLLGWLEKQGTDLAGSGNLTELLTHERILSYLEDRNQVSREKYSSDDNGFGRTQKNFLIRMSSLAKKGLCKNELAQRFQILEGHHRKLFVARREPAKKVLTLEDSMSVVWRLMEIAENPHNGLDPVKRGMLLRDAVIFAILTAIPYRRSILTLLEEGNNFTRVRNKYGDVWRVRLPKSQTKPRLRDLLHDIPAVFTPLIDFYVYHVRASLVGARHTSLFFNGRLDPITGHGIWDMFHKRTLEYLGTAHNPHQLRKAWANQWCDYFEDDYLSASAIMDTSIKSIELSYEQRSTRKAVKTLDRNMTTDRGRKPDKGQGTVQGGFAQC